MHGERSGAPRRSTRAGLRQALVAIVASAAVIGGIAAVSETSDERIVSLSSTTTSTSGPPAIVPSASTVVALPPISPISVPGDTVLSSPAAPIGTPLATTGASTAATSGPTDASVVASAVATAPASITEIPVAADAPAVSAAAYAVFDATNGVWLAGAQADSPRPVGSVMKLLTAQVVLEAGDLAKTVTVPQLNMDINESSIGLYTGEQLARDILFRAMLIVSANDAARALAIDVGGSIDGFVQMMNASAARLGLTSTVAANPIGLDAPGAQSSARDVITLAAGLMQDATFAQAVAKPTANLHKMVFNNTNKLLATYTGADGVKTGHTTDAGYCVVGSAVRDGRRIIVAVLGAPSEAQRFADAAALLDWGFSH